MVILIVDDDQFYLKGLISLIENNFKVDQIISANNLESAINILGQLAAIDLLLIDIALPTINDYSLVKLLNNNNITFRSILSNSDDIAKIHSAIRFSSFSFISKKCQPEKVIISLHKIFQGHKVISKKMQQQLDAFNCAKKSFVLTKRQDDVLILLKDGLSNQDISATLNISEHTVKSHVRGLFRLLDANNRIQCVENAKSIGIL